MDKKYYENLTNMIVKHAKNKRKFIITMALK